ncbi:MAG TPA: SPOR domain-containing protein [Wenzhouxiangella sp.]
MDDVLKQRLIGAAVLIALAVIFVPMLFDRSQDPMLEKALDSGMPQSPLADKEVRRIPLNPNASRQGPSTDEGSAVERPVVPMPSTEPSSEPTRERLALTATDEVTDEETSAPKQETDRDATQNNEAVSDAVDESVADVAVDERATSTDPSAQTQQSLSEDEAAAEAPSPSSSSASTDWSEGWRVQVASFGVKATADDIADALTAMDQSVRVDRIVRGESVLYRIQTGPYADRETAEQAQALISESVAGVAPVVRAPNQAGDDASDVAAGYAVQVGSFTSQANAERLQQRLVDQDFETFLVAESVGSRTIWRVRVGTVATRERADELLQALIDRAGVEGLVVSHP